MHADDFGFRVDYSHGIVRPAHSARARGMPILEAVRRGVVQNSFIASDIQARGRLSDHNRLHGFRFQERTSTLERLYRNLTVYRV
jgi:hypothetical protein